MTTETRIETGRLDWLVRFFLASAVAGGLAWLILMAAEGAPYGETALIERLLLFAPLVIVPLGLALSATPDKNHRHQSTYRVLGVAQPIGAILLIAALRRPQGRVAGLLAIGWLVCTALIAVFGLTRLLKRRTASAEELCIDVGLAYIAIGGLWLVCSRLGAQPMGFGHTIVLLTAVHFHYAGFSAPIIAGMTGRALKQAPGASRKAFRLAAAAVMAGPGLVAVGISTSPVIEVVAATLLAAGLLVLAFVTTLAIAPGLRSRLAGGLLVFSSASLAVTMGLACQYSIGRFIGRTLIDIPQMAGTHGIVNTFGFSLTGLVAWCLVRPKPAERIRPSTHLKAEADPV